MPSLSLPHYNDSLGGFVGELRAMLFDSQEEAAQHFAIHRSQISRYESDKARPRLGYVAELVRLFAERQHDPVAAADTLLHETNEAIRTHYVHARLKSWDELCKVARDYIVQQHAKKPSPSTVPPIQQVREADWDTWLAHQINLPLPTELVGFEAYLEPMVQAITAQEAPWLLAIDGLGGIGKTALARKLVDYPTVRQAFQQPAWIRAGQYANPIDDAPANTDTSPVLEQEELVDQLITALGLSVAPTLPFARKVTDVIAFLRQNPCLIVIDNLEKVVDYKTLLPLLRQFSHPTKVILTSRHSLQSQTGVYSLTINELNAAETLCFIRREAASRSIPLITNAPDAELHPIYEVVGGHPLALQLVVGQIAVTSLTKVLQNLQQYNTKDVNAMYTHIYWQAWQSLDTASQRILLTMPLTQNGTLAYIESIAGLDSNTVDTALQTLIFLSLVQMGGTLNQRRYSIHRLTETFLLNDAIGWKGTNPWT